MFHFIVKETELSKNKSYVSEIYFTKNQLYVEIENELKYIYINDTFYEIQNNKKRIINNQKIINGAFISFWWDFVNIDEIIDINIINETILCNLNKNDYLLKLLLDKNFSLELLEIITDDNTIRYKVNENLLLKNTEIPIPCNIVIYSDSVAIKESNIEKMEILPLNYSFFDLSKYKNYTIFEELFNFLFKNN